MTEFTEMWEQYLHEKKERELDKETKKSSKDKQADASGFRKKPAAKPGKGKKKKNTT